MLKKIERIDGLGVFDGYVGQAGLEDFGRFNIIYGLNGSGKTTLSRLLDCLNAGVSPSYPSLKYKIICEDGIYKEGQGYPCKIRVFNSDYVESNLGEIEGQLNPIYIVGEENQSLVSQVQDDEKLLRELANEQHKRETEKSKIEKERGKRFTNIAQVITSETSDQITRNYRKPNAEQSFKKVNDAHLLDEKQLDDYRSTARQNPLDNIDFVALQFNTNVNQGRLEDIPLTKAVGIIEQKTKAILGETSDSVAIARLRDNPEIAKWVEHGFELHSQHDKRICEYCQQNIPFERIDALGKHFNKSDRLLKEKIENIIDGLKSAQSLVQSISLPMKVQFYDELQDDYNLAVGRFNKLVVDLKNYLLKLDACLTGKLAQRTEPVEFDLQAFDEATFEAGLGDMNACIKKHNDKTDEFKNRWKDARAAIEMHHLSSIKPEIDEFDSKIDSINKRLSIISDGDPSMKSLGIAGLRRRITENRAKVANTAEAAQKLTELLQTFLGRNDLKFEPEDAGYRILRNGKAAKRLSEGERTAITFIYFIVQLSDQDFDTEKGIVVIDDPISSLDSNSVYQAFAFLKNAIKDAKQVILFTHNFDFLKLLLNWLKNIPRKSGKKAYFMLHCNFGIGDHRKSSIHSLDSDLQHHSSEYSYLFKQLYAFKSDGTIAGSYHIPNIARKVLESFLDFYYPGSDPLYRKLEKVNFDENKKTSIYKFANDLSHHTGKGFDPALIAETQKSVDYLLLMIEETSPIHYKSLTVHLQAA